VSDLSTEILQGTYATFRGTVKAEEKRPEKKSKLVSARRDVLGTAAIYRLERGEGSRRAKQNPNLDLPIHSQNKL
jgi:hypothetical protein